MNEPATPAAADVLAAVSYSSLPRGTCWASGPQICRSGTAGVGPSFPILGYDELTAAQVQSRLSELKKPELRNVLTYERNHANRKSVTGALEKAIG